MRWQYKEIQRVSTVSNKLFQYWIYWVVLLGKWVIYISFNLDLLFQCNIQSYNLWFSQFLSHISTTIYFQKGAKSFIIFSIFFCTNVCSWGMIKYHIGTRLTYMACNWKVMINVKCEINGVETFLSKLPPYLLAESHNSMELNVIVWIETTFRFRLLIRKKNNIINI